MARKLKLRRCPTCGASLPSALGEYFTCPECGMPIEVPETEVELEEEEELEKDWDEGE